MLEIHPSGIQSASDCQLRGVASMFPSIFTERGYKIERRRPGAGASVGHGVHASMAHLANAKMRQDEPKLHEAVEHGIIMFRSEIADGFESDATTPTANAAEEQIQKMTRSGWLLWGQDKDSLLIEQKFIAAISGEYSLSMTIDEYLVDDTLVDLKTGRVVNIYPVQLGAYSLGLKSHGYQPKALGHLFLKRTPPGKPAERPRFLSYDIPSAEQIAYAAAQRTMRDVDTFIETGDPNTFAVNPSSNLCGPKWCSLWGGDLCQVWKLKEAAQRQGANND